MGKKKKKNLTFIEAVDTCNHAQIAESIKRGEDINQLTLSGTGLMRAVKDGHLDTVKFLLHLGADVNIAFRGETALTIGLRKKHLKLSIFLVKNGANIDFITDSGTNPLIIALESGDTNILRVFLKYTSNINIQDNIGRTALFYAVQKGNIEAVKTLLLAGANPAIEDDLNKKAIDLSPIKKIKWIMKTIDIGLKSLIGVQLTAEDKAFKDGKHYDRFLLQEHLLAKIKIINSLVENSKVLSQEDSILWEMQSFCIRKIENEVRLKFATGQILSINDQNFLEKINPDLSFLGKHLLVFSELASYSVSDKIEKYLMLNIFSYLSYYDVLRLGGYFIKHGYKQTLSDSTAINSKDALTKIYNLKNALVIDETSNLLVKYSPPYLDNAEASSIVLYEHPMSDERKTSNFGGYIAGSLFGAYVVAPGVRCIDDALKSNMIGQIDCTNYYKQFFSQDALASMLTSLIIPSDPLLSSSEYNVFAFIADLLTDSPFLKGLILASSYELTNLIFDLGYVAGDRIYDYFYIDGTM